MAASLQVESTLTDKYQATVPDAIRKALKLNKRDKIRFVLQADGSVLLSRADPPESDNPSIKQFLELLAREMESHPERFRALSPALLKRARALTKEMRVRGDVFKEGQD